MAKEWAKAFYKSKEWKECRAAYIQSVNGLCERCLKKGIVNPGYIVHHKIHLTPENINNSEITLNWDNLEYVCKECQKCWCVIVLFDKIHIFKELDNP